MLSLAKSTMYDLY